MTTRTNIYVWQCEKHLAKALPCVAPAYASNFNWRNSFIRQSANASLNVKNVSFIEKTERWRRREVTILMKKIITVSMDSLEGKYLQLLTDQPYLVLPQLKLVFYLLFWLHYFTSLFGNYYLRIWLSHVLGPWGSCPNNLVLYIRKTTCSSSITQTRVHQLNMTNGPSQLANVFSCLHSYRPNSKLCTLRPKHSMAVHRPIQTLQKMNRVYHTPRAAVVASEGASFPRTDGLDVLDFHHVEFWCADAASAAGRFSFGLGIPFAAQSVITTSNTVI